MTTDVFRKPHMKQSDGSPPLLARDSKLWFGWLRYLFLSEQCLRTGSAARPDWRPACCSWRTWRPDWTSRCQRATTSCRVPRSLTRYVIKSGTLSKTCSTELIRSSYLIGRLEPKLDRAVFIYYYFLVRPSVRVSLNRMLFTGIVSTSKELCLFSITPQVNIFCLLSCHFVFFIAADCCMVTPDSKRIINPQHISQQF